MLDPDNAGAAAIGDVVHFHRGRVMWLGAADSTELEDVVAR